MLEKCEFYEEKKMEKVKLNGNACEIRWQGYTRDADASNIFSLYTGEWIEMLSSILCIYQWKMSEFQFSFYCLSFGHFNLI